VSFGFDQKYYSELNDSMAIMRYSYWYLYTLVNMQILPFQMNSTLKYAFHQDVFGSIKFAEFRKVIFSNHHACLIYDSQNENRWLIIGKKCPSIPESFQKISVIPVTAIVNQLTALNWRYYFSGSFPSSLMR